MNLAWLHNKHTGETPGNDAPPMTGNAPAAWCRYHAAMTQQRQRHSFADDAPITAPAAETPDKKDTDTAAEPRGDLYLLGATIATFGRFR